MQDQVSSDVQYKAMFGGEALEIKRHFRIRREPPPAPANINEESQEDVQALGEVASEAALEGAVRTPAETVKNASPEKKEEAPEVEVKPALIPFPEGFLCTRGAFKDAKYLPVAFGRTSSKPRDTLGY